MNITTYKLWAWALASFVTGVAGGLLAGSVGKLYTYQFPTRDSIILLAVVLMGGIYSLWGAVVAGALMKLLPALLDNWGLPADLLIDPVRCRRTAGAADGAGRPGRAGAQGPCAPGTACARTPGSRARGTGRAEERGAMIEIVGLTVRFGGVTPLDGMTRDLRLWHVRVDRAEWRR